MSQSPEVMEIEEASLRFALSGIKAGVNKKRSALERGATEAEAYTQGANQALGMLHSSGADEQALVEHLIDWRGLIDFALEDLLTEEEYAELVEE